MKTKTKTKFYTRVAIWILISAAIGCAVGLANHSIWLGSVITLLTFHTYIADFRLDILNEQLKIYTQASSLGVLDQVFKDDPELSKLFLKK